MKKAVSIFVVCVIVVLSAAAPCSAEQSRVRAKDLPAVIVCGYMSGQLYKNYGQENEQKIWGLKLSTFTDSMSSDPFNTLYTFFLLFAGKWETVGKRVGNGIKNTLWDLACGPDGKPVSELSTYPNDPAVSTYKYIMENRDGENVYEPKFVTEVAKEIGGENVFCFQYDCRTGIYDISDALNEYIDGVLEYTGAEKVNLFGISYGGFISAAYLSRFGTQAKVFNAVLNVPAMGGTSFAKIFLTGKTSITVDLHNLAYFGESLLGYETGLAKIVKFLPVDWAENFMHGFTSEEGALDLFRYWDSLWDLVTVEEYPELKAKMLDSTKAAEMIRKCDYVHNEIMPNYTEKFAACLESGVNNISVMCSYGSQTAFGGTKNNDLLIDADKASGAFCAPYGEHFATGYTPVYTTCTDRTHNHISPTFNIDGTSAYLPENTWYIEDQYHGQYAYDPVSLPLVEKLLFADDKPDVYTWSEYPQFMASKNSHLGVYAQFDESSCGFVGSDDKALDVENISTGGDIMLLGVKADGTDISFKVAPFTVLAPGETVRLNIDGKTPENGEYFTITVRYFRASSGISERKMSFMAA